jgi:hypothetical protein
MKAVVAYYHPSWKSPGPERKKTKSGVGKVFKVSPQLMSAVERRKFTLEAVQLIQGGKVDIPEQPFPDLAIVEHHNTPKPAETWKGDVTALKTLLQGGCNRGGDTRVLKKGGTAGMYREGFKWAVAQMAAGNLPKDGRAAAAALKSVGVNVTHITLFKGASKSTDAAATTAVTSPQRPGPGSDLPHEAHVELLDYVRRLRRNNGVKGRTEHVNW